MEQESAHRKQFRRSRSRVRPMLTSTVLMQVNMNNIS
jgi:hypothetical protein